MAAVRAALATAASAVTPPLNTHPYVPDAISPPCFYPGGYTVDFDKAFQRGMDDVTIECVVLVARSDDQSGQAALDAYLSGSGSASLKTALEAARGAPGQAALSGAADDLQVLRIEGYGLFTVGETAYYGAKLFVRVIGDGA